MSCSLASELEETGRAPMVPGGVGSAAMQPAAVAGAAASFNAQKVEAVRDHGREREVLRSLLRYDVFVAPQLLKPFRSVVEHASSCYAKLWSKSNFKLNFILPQVELEKCTSLHARTQPSPSSPSEAPFITACASQ